MVSMFSYYEKINTLKIIKFYTIYNYKNSIIYNKKYITKKTCANEQLVLTIKQKKRRKVGNYK